MLVRSEVTSELKLSREDDDCCEESDLVASDSATSPPLSGGSNEVPLSSFVSIVSLQVTLSYAMLRALKMCIYVIFHHQ